MELVSRTLAALAVALTLPSGLRSDAVTDWNQVTLATLSAVNEPRPAPSTRTLAMVHVAIYDAVNSIERRFVPYAIDAHPAKGASPQAAAIEAAYTVLSSMYPGQAQALDQAYATSLSAIPDGPGKTSGIAVGRFVGETVLALRSGDGSTITAAYNQPPAPGIWRPTPPNFVPAVWVAWANVTPFTLTRGSQFRPGPPPSIYKQRFAQELQEVKALGAADSKVRTPEQTEIALFWLESSQITWNHIAGIVAARHKRSLIDNARLFALLNLAEADAVIAVMDTKYTYNFWRPITAIQEGVAGGMHPIAPEPEWTPLQPTPFHPDYTSQHVIMGAASANVLAFFYRTDAISFSLTTGSLPNVVRSFHSFSQALDEMGNSRIYVGFHFRTAVRVGSRQGREIGDWVCDNFLTEDRDDY